MTRTLVSLATASIFALGCGHAAGIPGALAPRPSAAEAPAAARAPAGDAPRAAVESEAAPVAPAPARMPGDFGVYRFTGSFRSGPLTLTQRVIAREGSIVTIDFTAVEGTHQRQALRVRIDEASPTHNEVLSVASVTRGVERLASYEAYEALMASTTLAADSNEAVVGIDEVSVDVGGTSVPARQTTYRVRVGKHHATLRTLESGTFVWGDVGGEITADGGKVLYRAEVIEAGHDDDAARATNAE